MEWDIECSMLIQKEIESQNNWCMSKLCLNRLCKLNHKYYIYDDLTHLQIDLKLGKLERKFWCLSLPNILGQEFLLDNQ